MIEITLKAATVAELKNDVQELYTQLHLQTQPASRPEVTAVDINAAPAAASQQHQTPAPPTQPQPAMTGSWTTNDVKTEPEATAAPAAFPVAKPSDLAIKARELMQAQGSNAGLMQMLANFGATGMSQLSAQQIPAFEAQIDAALQAAKGARS